jgi:hypothetical protein
MEVQDPIAADIQHLANDSQRMHVALMAHMNVAAASEDRVVPPEVIIASSSKDPHTSSPRKRPYLQADPQLELRTKMSQHSPPRPWSSKTGKPTWKSHPTGSTNTRYQNYVQVCHIFISSKVGKADLGAVLLLLPCFAG